MIVGNNSSDAIGVFPNPLPDGITISSSMTASQAQTAIAYVVGSTLDSKQLTYAYNMYAKIYPNNPYQVYVSAITDYSRTCQTRKILFVDPKKVQPTYRYFYTHTFQGAAGAASNPLAVSGAYHGAELEFLFNTFANVTNYMPGPNDLSLSSLVQDYWSSFASTGNPNHNGDTNWPVYSSSTEDTLYLDYPAPSPAVVNGFDVTTCNFWKNPSAYAN